MSPLVAFLLVDTASAANLDPAAPTANQARAEEDDPAAVVVSGDQRGQVGQGSWFEIDGQRLTDWQFEQRRAALFNEEVSPTIRSVVAVRNGRQKVVGGVLMGLGGFLLATGLAYWGVDSFFSTIFEERSNSAPALGLGGAGAILGAGGAAVLLAMPSPRAATRAEYFTDAERRRLAEQYNQRLGEASNTDHEPTGSNRAPPPDAGSQDARQSPGALSSLPWDVRLALAPSFVGVRVRF